MLISIEGAGVLGILSGLFIGARYIFPPKHLLEKRTIEFCWICVGMIFAPIMGILLYPLWSLF